MAAPASNPSHLLISRNPRTVPPALAQTTTATSLYSPQPGPHLFSFDGAQAGAAGVLGSTGVSGGGNASANTNGNGYPFGGPYSSSPDPAAASSYTVGAPHSSSVHGNSLANSHSHSHSTHSVHMHMRSHSTPAFPITPMDEDSEDDEDDDIVVHPTFCRDAALPGRVKVIVGRYEFWCHKEVLWFASPFFNSLLQGCWAETAAAASKPSSPTDTDPNHADRARASEIDDELPDRPRSVRSESSPAALRRAMSSTHLDLVSSPAPTPVPSAKSPCPSPPHASPPRSRRSSHPQSLNIEYDDMDQNEHKASVYLDAEEDPANAADMMRELRELPDPTGSALDLIEGRDADRTPVAQVRQVAPPSPSTSPPRTPELRTLPVVPPERPRSAPAQNPSPPQPSPPPQQSLSPPLPLRLQGMTPACPPTVTAASARRASASRDVPGAGFDPNIAAWPGRTPAERGKNIDAVVELQEESPGAFQDFLFWAYPHLECKVTWTNVEGLLALSSKLIVPALQALCERFLMTHASGRPIVALALAEQHANAELYREASRFVLDQATWDVSELACLSEQTQLKLSHRRTWFLERLLKLGSIDPKKEYTCRPDCPDPSRCQAQLDEKWRQAHQAVSRYGPPQPSVAFRCLRQLETFPTNPSLVMPHPLCQTAAKSWVMTLFDRMFQPKMAFGALSPGTEKYWLYITLT